MCLCGVGLAPGGRGAHTDNRPMRCLLLVVSLALLALGAGCTPAFNWRTVRADAPGLELLLPCKPDKGARSLPFAGQQVQMSMLGCDAGGATFAVAWVALPPGIEVGDALRHWQTATLAHLHAVPPPADTRHAAFIPPGAWAVPQALRMGVSGQRANGEPVVADTAWFARRVGDTTTVFNAVVYSPQPDAAVAATFFEGIRVP